MKLWAFRSGLGGLRSLDVWLVNWVKMSDSKGSHVWSVCTGLTGLGNLRVITGLRSLWIE